VKAAADARSVGGGAHAADEHVVVAAMPERAALVAVLAEQLRSGGR
jgi:glutamate carboxypeptidase